MMANPVALPSPKVSRNELSPEEIGELNGFGARVAAALCPHRLDTRLSPGDELAPDTVSELNAFGKRLTRAFKAA